MLVRLRLMMRARPPVLTVQHNPEVEEIAQSEIETLTQLSARPGAVQRMSANRKMASRPCMMYFLEDGADGLMVTAESIYDGSAVRIT